MNETAEKMFFSYKMTFSRLRDIHSLPKYHLAYKICWFNNLNLIYYSNDLNGHEH